MFEFVDHYKKIKVGSKIKIKSFYLTYGSRQVDVDFIERAVIFGNVFKVESIQEINQSAMITVEEVKGFLEYDQVTPITQSKRIINWHREKKL